MSADSVEADKDGNHYLKINSNEPNYLYVNKGSLNCIRGYLRRADERLFISFYAQDKELAKEMRISGKLNDKSTKISQDTTRNVISVAFI